MKNVKIGYKVYYRIENDIFESEIETIDKRCDVIMYHLKDAYWASRDMLFTIEDLFMNSIMLDTQTNKIKELIEWYKSENEELTTYYNIIKRGNLTPGGQQKLGMVLNDLIKILDKLERILTNK